MRSIARSIARHRLIVFTVGLVVTVLAHGTGLVLSDTGDIALWDVLAQLVYVVGGSLGFTLVGSTILVQRPGHRIGRLMMVMGVSLALSLGGPVIIGALAPEGMRSGAIPELVVAMVNTVGFLAIVVGAALLIVWFPDGRTTSRLGTTVQALVLVILISQSVAPLDPTFGESELWFVLLLIAYASALVDVLVRYRRADGVRRTQIRWVLASGSVTASLVVALVAFGDQIDWLWQLWILSTILPPIAVGIAITRYHLYEIDRIMRRTIGYDVVSAALVLVFAAVNLALQSAIGGITRNDPLVVAASTLSVAVLFNPVRSRVQSVVDRRFNRARFDAERTTTAAVEPASSAVWLRAGDVR